MKTALPNLNIYELNQFYQNICIEIMKGETEKRSKDEVEELKRLLWQVHSKLAMQERQKKQHIRALA